MLHYGMSDYYIKHFYDQVKDSSWPEIKSYNDLLNLPTIIKNDCNHMHNLGARLSEIEDPTYWKKYQFHKIGYQHKNVVYVPILKCANTYYTNFFKDQLKWKQVNLDDLNWNEISAFGLVMNPMTRRVKGITQVLCMSYKENYKNILQLLESPYFVNFVSKIMILDAHTIPYTLAFGEMLDKIYWIPIEPFTDSELQHQITCFLNTKNIKIKMPTSKRLNRSSNEKEKIFNTIQDIFLSTEPGAELGMLFANDIKFYNHLLKHRCLT